MRGRLSAGFASSAPQLLRFCVVGSVGYVVNLSLYSLLERLGMDFRAAAVVSFAVSVSGNYLLHRAWTFRSQRGHFGTQGVRFATVSLLALGTNELWLSLLVLLGLGKVSGQALACLLVIPVSFGGNKLWAFRAPHRPLHPATRLDPLPGRAGAS